MGTPKTTSLSLKSEKNFMFTMASGNDAQYPLAYAKSIWDVADNDAKAELVSLLGGTEGQYTQEEINKAVAAKLAEIATDLGKVASAGAYVSNNGSPFNTSQQLTGNLGNKGDYALVRRFSATTDQTAQNGKTYYADAQGTALGSQPTAGADISSAGYYEVASLTRYHKGDSSWTSDYTLPKSQFTIAQWELIEAGNLDAAMMQKLSELPTAAMLSTLLDDKADKVANPTSGNFAGLDSNGNLTDSGSKAADFATAAQGALADSAYQKPSEGIPSTDMTAAVQTSLGKADTSEQAANKESSIGDSNRGSTTKYPSVKAVYDYVNDAISQDKATFRGTFESVADLPTKGNGSGQVSTLKNNDYAFVYDLTSSQEGNPEYNRYKYVEKESVSSFKYANKTYVRDDVSNDGELLESPNYPTYAYVNQEDSTDKIWIVGTKVFSAGTVAACTSGNGGGAFDATVSNVAYNSAWVFEYKLNNSGLTAAQWNAVNSGVNSTVASWAASHRLKVLQGEVDEAVTVEIHPTTGNNVTYKSSGTSFSIDTTPSDVTSMIPSGGNPSSLKLYEKDGNNYVLTSDSSAQSGKTYYGYPMTLYVSIKYKGTGVTPDNESALLSAGWVKVTDGIYKIIKFSYYSSGSGHGASLSETSFKYTPASDAEHPEYAEFTAEKKISLTASVIYPFYYGLSIPGTNDENATSAIITSENVQTVIDDTNTNRNNGTTGSVTLNKTLTTAGRVWVICLASKSVTSFKQLGSSVDLVNVASGISFTKDGISISGYRAFVTKLSAKKVSDAAITVG